MYRIDFQSTSIFREIRQLRITSNERVDFEWRFFLYKRRSVRYTGIAKTVARSILIMAHKKVERRKELQRKRHRREQRLKQRIREAKGKT